MIADGAVWARIGVTLVPIDPRRKLKEIQVDVEVCSMPDPGDAIGSWSVELHTEGGAPASGGAGKALGQDRAEAVPKEAFHAEVVFRSMATLTHIKSRCETWKGERFMKAIKLPEALAFMPGDRARVEIHVFRDSTARVARPSVEVFEEPEIGHQTPAPAAAPQLGIASKHPPYDAQGRPQFWFRPSGFGLTGPIPTRPIGLFH
jgi:hypothetical protein